MEDKPEKGRKYLICFKEGKNWTELFLKNAEEKNRISQAYYLSQNSWKVAFRERRVERAVKSIYEPFCVTVTMTGDDYHLFSKDRKPLFIVSDIQLLSI